MVGRVILWVLLGLLLLFVLFLVLPTTVHVLYQEGALRIRVRVLLVRLTLWPMKPGREKKPRRQRRKRKKQKPKEEPSADPETPEKTLASRLDFIKRVAESAGAAGGLVLRGLKVHNVEATIVVNTGEAADTALWYGRLCGIVGELCAVLQKRMDIRITRLDILPDFADSYKNAGRFACKISAAPVILVAAGIVGIKRFLQYNKPPKNAAPQRSDTHGR